mmetsp:Transcript_10638/g.19301  ORF Transcript_10638/g.19301 Transcript_10638/m.19301 type:complete len:227 (-) Transcript_10638:100-780(-)
MFWLTSAMVAEPRTKKARAMYVLPRGSTLTSWLSAVKTSENVCWKPLEIIRTSLPKWSGLMDGSKKCKRGNGTKFMVISFKSRFKEPSNRMELVRLFNRCATREFIRSKGFSAPSGTDPPPPASALLLTAAAEEGCDALPGGSEELPAPARRPLPRCGGCASSNARSRAARGGRGGMTRSSCGSVVRDCFVACDEIWLQMLASASLEMGKTQCAQFMSEFNDKIVL